MYRIRFIVNCVSKYQNDLFVLHQRLQQGPPASLAMRTLTYGNNQNLQRVIPGESEATKPKKKTKEVPKITVIGKNQALSITTLGEAQKLAKRRDLHLIQVDQSDSKTGRAVYKMVTSAEMLAQEMATDGKSKDEHIQDSSEKDKGMHKKSEKSLTIGIRITEHDLSSRTKNIAKWLAKRHEVRVLIQGSADDANCERIVKAIEQSVKEPQVIGKIVQKRSKGAVTKFNIIPIAHVSPATTPTPNQS